MRYTAAELEAMPTLREGYADDLKVETEDMQVWLSRATRADGAPYDNQVTVKRLNDRYEWVVSAEYRG